MNASMISCIVDTSYARWKCAHLMWSWGVGFHSFRAMFYFSLRKARWGATHSSSVFFLAMSDLGHCIERRTPWIFFVICAFFRFLSCLTDVAKCAYYFLSLCITSTLFAGRVVRVCEHASLISFASSVFVGVISAISVSLTARPWHYIWYFSQERNDILPQIQETASGNHPCVDPPDGMREQDTVER